MNAFVLDCSIAAAWHFEDEAKPETDALLVQLRDGGAFVSNLWHLELGKCAHTGRAAQTDYIISDFHTSRIDYQPSNYNRRGN